MFQAPDKAAGQFFFAKAFDKFAPLGPTLISPDLMKSGEGMKLKTSINGEILQEVDLSLVAGDLVFSPAQILSHMSQGNPSERLARERGLLKRRCILNFEQVQLSQQERLL